MDPHFSLRVKLSVHKRYFGCRKIGNGSMVKTKETWKTTRMKLRGSPRGPCHNNMCIFEKDVTLEISKIAYMHKFFNFFRYFMQIHAYGVKNPTFRSKKDLPLAVTTPNLAPKIIPIKFYFSLKLSLYHFKLCYSFIFFGGVNLTHLGTPRVNRNCKAL